MIATLLPTSCATSSWRSRLERHPGGVLLSDHAVISQPGDDLPYNRVVTPVLTARSQQTVNRSIGDNDFSWLTALAPSLTDEIPWSDRRITDRSPARPGARIEIRRCGIPSGPDLADHLFDVSESGIRVRFTTPVRPGERFDVTLWAPDAAWCGRGLGIVRWSVIGESRVVLAGIQFNRRLAARVLCELA